jgi:hypothetical protein
MLKTFKVSFIDNFFSNNEKECYQQLLSYLRKTVLMEDVTAFKFERVKKIKKYNKNVDIIPTILRELITDDSNESESFIRYYNELNNDERKIVDNILMFITGWSFDTLYNKGKE